MKITALPWTVTNRKHCKGIWSKSTCTMVVQDRQLTPEGIEVQMNPKDVEFILRACNAHEALVKALDACRMELRILINGCDEKEIEDSFFGITQAIGIANSALKLAEGNKP